MISEQRVCKCTVRLEESESGSSVNPNLSGGRPPSGGPLILPIRPDLNQELVDDTGNIEVMDCTR